MERIKTRSSSKNQNPAGVKEEPKQKLPAKKIDINIKSETLLLKRKSSD